MAVGRGAGEHHIAVASMSHGVGVVGCLPTSVRDRAFPPARNRDVRVCFFLGGALLWVLLGWELLQLAAPFVQGPWRRVRAECWSRPSRGVRIRQCARCFTDVTWRIRLEHKVLEHKELEVLCCVDDW